MKKIALFLLLSATCFASHCFQAPKISYPMHVTNMSRLPPDLTCLNLNCPSTLTGYNYYQNVAFDPQIAVNPKDHKNIVIVAQQDALANATYNASLPIASIVLYTLNGGKSWGQSHIVMSRCQGATDYKSNTNFISAYFPSVSFDQDGICYIFTSSYNLFEADHQVTENFAEGNIIAKSVDGGLNWTQPLAATRDEGTCHYLDFPHMTCDPYRARTVYIVSSDNTCLVSESCEDPDFTGNQNIVFQKTADAGLSWTSPSLIHSFEQDTPDQCTPIPMWHQLAVLPDHEHALFVSSMIQRSPADMLESHPHDELFVWKSKDEGKTWHKKRVAKIPHVLVVDPDEPTLPVTCFTTKDMAVNHCTGYIYLVYTDPQFNPTGQAGCVIRMSKDGGTCWSKPRPINPKSLDVQTFLPTVAVAKDGTVGVLFYDFRSFETGDPELNTDVWMAFFDEELEHHLGEALLTPNSFDTRESIRGYNGVDQENCQFDYYISNHVGVKSIGNDFVAAFTVTNNKCPVATIGSFPCDSFPLTIDNCNRQDIVFVHIKRE